jgi:hypothetical protein
MTSSSNRRPELRSIIAMAAFFTIAAYTSFGCGLIPPVPTPHAAPPAVSVNIMVKDFTTGDPVEGAHVTMTQGPAVVRMSAGIGGSAYFVDGFGEGPVVIEVSANGYEPQRVSSALIKGYNKEEVILHRRSQ